VCLVLVLASLVLLPAGASAYSICTACVGWDGPGQGSASLTYYFGPLTQDNGLTDNDVKAVVVAALNAWSQVAAVTWSETTSPNLSRSVDIGWSTGTYGPWGAPFPSGALAVSYYPTPNNMEPLAGNIYLNDAYTWAVDGSDYDIFSVVLHELGHSLGLAHSTDPTSAMYPVYHKVTALTADDVAGILTLYAPGSPAGPPPNSDGGSSALTTPEPGTLLLVGSGLAGLAGWIRRRHRSPRKGGRTRAVHASSP